MKAAVIEEFGGDLAVRDIPASEPGDGELLVDVGHAAFNGMDVGVWAGIFKDRMQYELPITLGREFAGTVAQVGPGASGYRVGAPVIGVHLKTYLHDGTFAEQVAVSANATALRPAGIEPAAAGALRMAGISAQLAVGAVGPQPGDTALISGATGGVGAIAIQLVKQRGARVIASLARTDRKPRGGDNASTGAADRGHQPSGPR